MARAESARAVLFAPFEKIDELDDGTLKVYGVASSESPDSDGETVKATAMRTALPDYLTFGAVREMHQPIAAGTAIEASVDDQGVTHFGAHVVDVGSVKKVKTGVLKGFSIGGKVTKRDATNKKIITALRLTEISLVDRPANPDARITLVKFDSAGKVKPLEKSDTDAADVEPHLRKGMYDVAALAELITRLDMLRAWSLDEALWEGDASDMPAKLKAAVENLCGLLRDMVDEETAELLGIADESADVAAAAKTIAASSIATFDNFRASLEKKGAKFSKATVGVLATVHKMLTDGCSMFENLAYTKVDNQEDDMNDTEKKAADDAAAAALKASGTAELITKFDGMAARLDALEKADKAKGDEIATLKSENATLADTNQKLAKAASDLLAKGAVRPIAKRDDGTPRDNETPDDVAKRAAKDPLVSMRAAHRQPLSPVRGTSFNR